MIAFLSHEASRTGAPIMFLHFLKWYKANQRDPFLIIIKKDGEISEDFKKQGKTFVIYPKTSNPWRIRLIRIFGPVILYFKLYVLLLILKKNKIKLIYSNSITNGNITSFYSRRGFLIITHVHELEQTILQYGESNIIDVLKSTNHFVAASEAVKNILLARYYISPGLIDVVYECIDIREEAKFIGTERINALIKIGIDDPNAFIIGGCGILDFRKATEIFVLVANQTISNNPDKPFYFIWLGADTSDHLYSWFISDIEKMGLNGKVLMLPSVTDPYDYYRLFDLFLLTSREDPFPLVCLESASLGSPVLCFDKAGGMPEFVKNDAGFVIRYLNITEMSKKIEVLYNDENLRRNLGEKARDKVIDNYTVNNIAPQIDKIINKVQK